MCNADRRARGFGRPSPYPMGGGGGFSMMGGPRHDYGGFPMDASPFGPGGMMGFGGPMPPMGGGGRFNKFPSNTTDYGGFSSESFSSGYHGGFGGGRAADNFFPSKGVLFEATRFC